MGLLEKLIREGWWDRSKRPEIRIDIANIPEEKIDELLEKKSTIVTDEAGNSYSITIPAGVDVEDLTDDDFEVIELPGVAAIAEHETHVTSR